MIFVMLVLFLRRSTVTWSRIPLQFAASPSRTASCCVAWSSVIDTHSRLEHPILEGIALFEATYILLYGMVWINSLSLFLSISISLYLYFSLSLYFSLFLYFSILSLSLFLYPLSIYLYLYLSGNRRYPLPRLLFTVVLTAAFQLFIVCMCLFHIYV